MKTLGLLACLSAGIACSDAAEPVSDCSGYPAQTTSPYALPFAIGEQWLVVQANCTRRSNATHRANGMFQYAYDFGMPIGTPILAARSGTVSYTEGQYADGNRVPGEENLVFVTHDDGTIARYYHLTQNGVRVAVGDVIERGALLGLSGDTGNSSMPHLHFDVATCPQVGCATLPLTFRNTRAHSGGLLVGERYEAVTWTGGARVTGP